MESGGQCVMIPSVALMLLLLVISWDIMIISHTTI